MQRVLGTVPTGSPQPSPLPSVFDHVQRQAFCSDPEGWGPVSLKGFYLTSCFVDVTVAVVAVWGILAGLAALWLLLKKRTEQPVAKNWHFYAKLVRLSCEILVYQPVLILSVLGHSYRLFLPVLFSSRVFKLLCLPKANPRTFTPISDSGRQSRRSGRWE